MKNKKSQSAIEFLVTYGWVFIIIMIAAGALVYLGVTEPDTFIQPYCEFTNKLKCKDYALAKDGANGGTSGFIVKLQNNFERPIAVYNVYGVDVSVDLCKCSELNPTEFFLGQTKTIWCNLNDELVEKTKRKITIVVEWSRNETDALKHNTTGIIYSRVCDGEIDPIVENVTAC